MGTSWNAARVCSGPTPDNLQRPVPARHRARARRGAGRGQQGAATRRPGGARRRRAAPVRAAKGRLPRRRGTGRSRRPVVVLVSGAVPDDVTCDSRRRRNRPGGPTRPHPSPRTPRRRLPPGRRQTPSRSLVPQTSAPARRMWRPRCSTTLPPNLLRLHQPVLRRLAWPRRYSLSRWS